MALLSWFFAERSSALGMQIQYSDASIRATIREYTSKSNFQQVTEARWGFSLSLSLSLLRVLRACVLL